jgi:hypothetical protein
LEQESVEEEVQRSLIEFYAKLDMTVRPSFGVSRDSENGQPMLLSLGTDPFIKSLASKVQGLEGSYSSKEELAASVAEMMREDPRFFIFFMHLFRQIKFTNVELLHFMFDQDRLDDLDYYESLMAESEMMQLKSRRMLGRKPWKELFEIGPKDDRLKVLWDSRPGRENELLHFFKKIVYMYCGSEKASSVLWLERVRSDEGVRKRVARFLVKNENLDQVIRSGMVMSLFERSVRLLHVEQVKAKRGKFAPEKIARSLGNRGFVQRDFEGSPTIEEVEGDLRRGRYSDELIYTQEKKWISKELGRPKVFDFVLCSRSGVEFFMETNYFTTGMSKIGEVVENFKKLHIACERKKRRFIYVTDGMGWIGLNKAIKSVLELDVKGRRTRLDRKIPLLMNIRMFDEWLPTIVESLR